MRESEYTLRIRTEKPQEVIRRINLLLSNYLPEIYRYNSLIKDKKYYLKPVHIVIKRKSNGNKIRYYYYGRYWYRIERNSSGKIKWVYLGREKPDRGLPDPPKNPLEGLVVKISNGEVVILAAKRETYQLIYEALTSLQPVLETPQAP